MIKSHHLLTALAASLLALPVHGAISFTGLGQLPGRPFFGPDYFNTPTAVSSDGSVVVGTSEPAFDPPGTDAPGPLGWRWTTNGGMVSIGLLPDNDEDDEYQSFATADGVSGDGTIAVGWATNMTYQVRVPIRWTAGGVEFTGDLPGGVGISGMADDISTDGSTTVGWSSSASGIEAFRLTAGGMVGLGDLPGGAFRSEARAVSGDGQSSSAKASALQAPRRFAGRRAEEWRALVICREAISEAPPMTFPATGRRWSASLVAPLGLKRFCGPRAEE